MDPNESVLLPVNILATNGNGTLLLPLLDIVTRNDVLIPPFPDLLQLPVTEVLLALPHHMDAATIDLRQLLVTVLKETIIQLARQLPEIIIRQAFAFHEAFEKHQFFNMIDEASREHSTQPSLVKRLNILRKAWCATRTPPLNAPIPVSIAHLIIRAPAPCNLSDEQKIEKFTQMVQDKDFPYLDLPSVLLELGAETVQNGLNRRVEQLKQIVFTKNDFQAIMDSFHAQINMRKAIIYSKAHRLYINGKSPDVARILHQFKSNLLGLPALEGTQRQQLRQILLSDHRHTVEAARILSRLTFPCADSDGGFTTVHNQEEVKRNRVRMTNPH